MYAHGDRVVKDSAEAVRWFRMAAEQGDAHAQFNLGVAYGNREGDPQGLALAADWFRRAALTYLAKGEREAAFVCAERIRDLRNAPNKVLSSSS